MRKTLLLLAIVLAILTGCANSEDVLENTFLGEEVLTDEQLQSTVPIRFAPVSITATVEEMPLTRTSYGNNDIISGLGMYCLVKRILDSNAPIPSWKDASKDDNFKRMCIWKKNEPVSLKMSGVDKGDIVWDNTMNSAYFPCYPDNEWYAYGFVAYYPRTDNIVYAYSAISAYIKLDGSKPVFYGMAKEPLTDIDEETKNLAFSKSYYEALDAESGTEKYINPYFEFEYLTSALNFVFWSKGEPQTNFHVEKIEFDNFPCIMSLGLATMLRYASKKPYNMKSSIANKPFIVNQDKFDENNLSQFEELAGGPFGHFELYEDNGESISGKKNADGSYKYTLTTEKMKVGGSIYIPPVYSGHSREALNIYITVADDAGNTYKSQSPIVVKTKTGWKKGTSYDIPIYLSNPAEAAKDARLAQWEPGEPIEVNATNTEWKIVP